MSEKELFNQTSDKQKLQFLEAIMLENPDLQKSFLHFIEATNDEVGSLSYEEFNTIINDSYVNYLDLLESVDLENPDWDQYEASDTGYLEEWEQYQEASEQEFESVFDDFCDEAIALISTQDIGELTAMMIGLYLAAREADIDDPLSTFENVNEFLINEHKVTVSRLSEKIKLSAISDVAILQATSLFFQHFNGVDLNALTYVPVFENFLMALASKTTQPEAIYSQLSQSRVDWLDLPRLTLMLTEKTGTPSDWLRVARSFYKENREIAKQLLEYYIKNDQSEFVDLSNELFDQEPGSWAPAISKLVTKEINLDLFVKVNYKLVTDAQNLDYYLLIKPFLSREMKDRLLSELKWDEAFKVQILETEERYEEIRQIVEANPTSWDYHELIKPILTIYPEFCFDQIKRMALTTIASERGRSVYQRIVALLQLADTIPGYKAQTRILARELYQNKPSLPALKDELKKGGLV